MAYAGLALPFLSHPQSASAEMFSDLLECAAVFDVLDVTEMEDPAAFRAELDAASTLFADLFQSLHGISLTKRLRTQYQEEWQAKPPTQNTAEALARKLTFCESEASLRGVPIGVTEQRLLRAD
ncbi:MAG: hypothetical protein ACU0GG_11510 [Paracoccaceae bacterium]